MPYVQRRRCLDSTWRRCRSGGGSSRSVLLVVLVSRSSLAVMKFGLGHEVGLVGTCRFALVEHHHDDCVVVMRELVVDVVRCRRAHVAWR